jgi:hypothetical protein
LNSLYETQAAALFGGGGVLAAASDYTSGSGVFVSVGVTLYLVDPAGGITLMGPVSDSSTRTSLVPSGLAFLGRNLLCGGSSTLGTQFGGTHIYERMDVGHAVRPSLHTATVLSSAALCPP